MWSTAAAAQALAIVLFAGGVACSRGHPRPTGDGSAMDVPAAETAGREAEGDRASADTTDTASRDGATDRPGEAAEAASAPDVRDQAAQTVEAGHGGADGADRASATAAGCDPAPDFGRAPYTPGVVAGCPAGCLAGCVQCLARGDAGGTVVWGCPGGAGISCLGGASCDGPEDCRAGQVCVRARATVEFGYVQSLCRDLADEGHAFVPGDVPVRLCHADGDCRCDQRCLAGGCARR